MDVAMRRRLLARVLNDQAPSANVVPVDQARVHALARGEQEMTDAERGQLWTSPAFRGCYLAERALAAETLMTALERDDGVDFTALPMAADDGSQSRTFETTDFQIHVAVADSDEASPEASDTRYAMTLTLKGVLRERVVAGGFRVTLADGAGHEWLGATSTVGGVVHFEWSGVGQTPVDRALQYGLRLTLC